MKSNYLSNEKKLQNYGAMFENLAKDLDLKTELEEFGYNEEEIAKGKALYDTARQTFDTNVQKTKEENKTSLLFQDSYQKTLQQYAADRKKARIIFEDNEEALMSLNLNGRTTQIISKSLEEMRAFYQTLDNSENLLTPLSQLKIDAERVKQQLKALSDTDKKYADYLKEKGESQQATRDKNEAFAKLDKWVSKFYKIAKIALEDRPQLLESLGKFVRS